MKSTLLFLLGLVVGAAAAWAWINRKTIQQVYTHRTQLAAGASLIDDVQAIGTDIKGIFS